MATTPLYYLLEGTRDVYCRPIQQKTCNGRFLAIPGRHVCTVAADVHPSDVIYLLNKAAPPRPEEPEPTGLLSPPVSEVRHG